MYHLHTFLCSPALSSAVLAGVKSSCSMKETCCRGIGTTNVTIEVSRCEQIITNYPCSDVVKLCKCRAGKVL